MESCSKRRRSQTKFHGDAPSTAGSGCLGMRPLWKNFPRMSRRGNARCRSEYSMAVGDLVLEGISKTYDRAGKVPAVENATLAVERGQFLTLLGPSGCGKTTLLRIVSGFIAPSSGHVWVRGRDVTALPPQE